MQENQWNGGSIVAIIKNRAIPIKSTMEPIIFSASMYFLLSSALYILTKKIVASNKGITPTTREVK